MPSRRTLRDWWPTLVIVVLGIVSVEVLYSSFRRWQDTLENAVSSIDSLSQARLRAMRAYLGLERGAAGDPTFGAGIPLAELAAAQDALDDFLRGRSGVLGLSGDAPRDSTLIALGREYRRELGAFATSMEAGPIGAVEARTHFSDVERAASALEAAVHERVRDRIGGEERRFQIRLGAWSAFLLLTAFGTSFARRRMLSAELARARSDARLGELRGLAPLGIVECDPEGRIRAANRWWAESTGQPESRWRGRPWWEALPDEEREDARERWARAMEGGLPASADFRLDSPDGGPDSVRWVLVRWAPSRLEAADDPSWVVTFTDISERREVEEQLRQAQKMQVMGQLTGSIAHDFNNLLTVIVANVQLLKEVVELGPEDASLLDDLERAGDGGVELVRSLLQFSRRSALELRPLDLARTVRENARLIERLLPASVTFRMAVGEGVPAVRGDAGAIQQILLNLATNARDAMPGGGSLTLQVLRVDLEPGHPAGLQPGPHAALLISDTGAGITPEVRERIFQPFFTTKKAGEGTGLGLATVLGLVQRHDGHIDVDSEPGKGTTFRILLPAVAEAAGARPPGTGAPRGTEGRGPVLVVEEDRKLRKAMRRILERAGHAVVEADGAVEAARLVQQGGVEPGLVLAHLVMPEMSGLELYRALGREGSPPPFVLTSGHPDGSTRPANLPRDAVYLPKPWTTQQLLEAVSAALSGAQG